MNRDEHTVRVARKVGEALDICSFELVDLAGGTLPAFSAGSHIDVHVPNGLTRQYSLCNDPAETHRYLIGVLKDAASRGGSRGMHDLVNEGDTLTISAPKNHFQLEHAAQQSLLLAGGIGITPILCMAERLAANNADFELHYSARTKERMAFRERISGSPFAGKTFLHLDDGDESQKLDLDSLLTPARPGRHLYVCGPKGFMEAVLARARASGWQEPQLHYEFFAAEVASSEADSAFEVVLGSSGRRIAVSKDQTVIQALANAHITVQASCEQGVCGTCLTRVLEGEPEHRDLYLTPDEQARNDQFLPCCSRSKSATLVLDL